MDVAIMPQLLAVASVVLAAALTLRNRSFAARLHTAYDLAGLDDASGLHPRTTALSVLRTELSRARRSGTQVSIVLIDAPDLPPVRIGLLLLELVTPPAIPFRFGDDRYLVVCPMPSDPTTIVKQLQALAGEQVLMSTTRIDPSTSSSPAGLADQLDPVAPPRESITT